MTSRRRSSLALAAVLALAAPACDLGDAPAPTAREQADALLRLNAYHEAAAAYDALLADAPADQALHLRAGLAAVGESIDQFNFLLTLVLAALQDAEVVADLSGAAATENDYILGFVENLIVYLSEPLDRAVAHLSAVDDPDFQSDLGDLQLQFWAEPFFDFGGTWDTADAAFLQAALAPLAAALNVVEAHDLSLDVYFLIHAFLADGGVDGAAEVANVIVQLLQESHPNALDLKIDGGNTLMALARTQLAQGSRRFLGAVEAAAARPADTGVFRVYSSGSDRVLALVDRVRKNERGFVDLKFQIDPTASFQTVEVPLSEGWLSATERIAENLEAAPGAGPFLSPVDDFVAVLAPLAIATIQNVDIPELLNLGPDTAATYEDIVDIELDPDLVVTLVDGVLPDGLWLDPTAWLQGGRGLRHLIPAHRTDLAAARNNFLFEWECPLFFAPNATDPVGTTGAWPGGLTCPDEGDEGFEDHDESDFDLFSGPHFGDPVFATLEIAPIADDGYATDWPVIPWHDASWAGLLRVEEAEVLPEALDPADGIAAATNLSLNAWLALLDDQLDDLF